MSTAEQRLANVQQVAQATSGMDPAVQAAAIAAVVPPPIGEGINQIWQMLVGGLLLILLIALLGVLYLLIDDKDADLAVTLFTTVLAGLLGLFAPSPTAAGKAE